MPNVPPKSRLRRVRSARNSVCISAALEDLDWKRCGKLRISAVFVSKFRIRAAIGYTAFTAGMHSSRALLRNEEASAGFFRNDCQTLADAADEYAYLAE
jgi:hypothetical protein